MEHRGTANHSLNIASNSCPACGVLVTGRLGDFRGKAMSAAPIIHRQAGQWVLEDAVFDTIVWLELG